MSGTLASISSLQPSIRTGIMGFHAGSSAPAVEQLARMSYAMRTTVTREAMFAYMGVVRRAVYASAPYETFRGPSGYRGRITTMRGGGARAKFASAGFGNIIEAGRRKRVKASLDDGKTSRGQITKGMLKWMRENAPQLAAEMEAAGSTSIWLGPMDPKPWVLPTFRSVQAQALEAFRAEMIRQVEVALGE